MLSSDHPSGPRLPGQRGGYFDRELVTDRWVKDGVDVVQHFWRRPLSQTVDAFADAGFVVDRIAEPQPSAEALARFPDDWPPSSARRGSRCTACSCADPGAGRPGPLDSPGATPGG